MVISCVPAAGRFKETLNKALPRQGESEKPGENQHVKPKALMLIRINQRSHVDTVSISVGSLAVHIQRIAVADHIGNIAFKGSDVGIRRQRPGAAAVQDDVHSANFRRDGGTFRVDDFTAHRPFKGGTIG